MYRDRLLNEQEKEKSHAERLVVGSPFKLYENGLAPHGKKKSSVGVSGFRESLSARIMQLPAHA